MPENQNKDKELARSDNSFPVVGVGASAGGLEAFKRLVHAIPESSGMAYILVQHLEPNHQSLLSELLQKLTTLPVQEITDNIRVEPNHIYVIPSNKLLTANDGILQLSPRTANGARNMPIDLFFQSLAEVHQSHAIGVVLSGTANDGTLGLKAIRDHGGMTFAQEQQSAPYPSMPQHAIDAEVVDFILTPEEIPMQLARLHQAFPAGPPVDTDDIPPKKEDVFRQLLSLLRARKGVDFTYYKQTTIRRRIIRRMGLSKIEHITDYLQYIRENLQELDILYQDLLIPVTGFFRDPKIYETLRETIFPVLLTDRDEMNPLRIWVAGCSTGEEPYSIAICLQDYLGEKAADHPLQIFATDISEKAIAKARSGIYTRKEVTGLSAGHLEKYFTRVPGGYHLVKSTRDLCVFASHNFLKDPPFARMDVISCRNVLIYLEPYLQKRALTTFHYALRDNAYLLLGKSESIGPASDLFAVVDKTDKLYSKRQIPSKFLPGLADRNPMVSAEQIPPVQKEIARSDFQKSADDILLHKYTPPGVVINGQMDIVQFRGSTGAWLESPPGKPSTNVFKMAREGLAFELRNTLHQARTNNQPVVKENIHIRSVGGRNRVTIDVIPLPHTAEPHFLVLFRDTTPSIDPGKSADTSNPGHDGATNVDQLMVRRLEEELSQLREDIRAITEDQESVNQELQSTNEELLSGSEELQSLNEELETSKEEIQSSNEELSTLNHELFDRNEQLNLARLYAESIVATIREPLIILDSEMRVKSANKAYYDKFRTTEEETEGLLFYKLMRGKWNLPALHSMLENTLLKERKVTGFQVSLAFDLIGERHLVFNASQIIQRDGSEQLILLAIEDVTDAKKLEAESNLFTLELGRQVEERTALLRSANASLQYSNANLDQFATIASHDLQEPLRKIRTFIHILRKRFNESIKGEPGELLEKINTSAERMSALIRDVLNFSRITDRSAALEKTDLNRTLQNVLADFELMIAEKKAVLHYMPLPVITAIPLQISQLFMNMLGNALKFAAEHRSPVINITTRALPADELKKWPLFREACTYHEIVFTDNGIGFDDKFSEDIFMIFHRLQSNEHSEGTGIGLALCKKIVLNHGGAIFADGRPGEGASFHIILPEKQP